MKKMVYTLFVGIIFSLMFSVTAFAKTETCDKSGCNKSRSGDSYYCYEHKCHHGSCKKASLSGSRYCSNHTCQGGRTSCKKEVSGANEKCSSCKSKSSSSSSSSSKSTGTSTTKKTTKTTKKTNSKNYSKSVKSYDEGYEAISEDDDYDWDRYKKDRDYADGVDDAMEDYDW